jgi:hypothetical protein
MQLVVDDEETATGGYVVRNGDAIRWQMASLSQISSGVFLQSVVVPPLEYVCSLPGRAPGLVLTHADGITRAFAPTAVAIVSSGPLAVNIRYNAPDGLSVDLCFPVSRSWCEIVVRQEESDSSCVTALQLDAMVLNVSPPSTAAPTMCDFGAGTAVYAALTTPESRARLSAGPSGTWSVCTHDAAEPVDNGWVTMQQGQPGGATGPAEGWAHVMDRQRCVAIAVSEFGKGADDTLTVGGNGTVRVERRLDWPKTTAAAYDASEPALLRCYYHIVPFPPQASAATQPQAMLAPVHAALI